MNKDNSRRISAIAVTAALVCAFSSSSQAGEWSANASMTSNYIWRGLTQTENEAAVQGGIDYAGDSGFYVGTWASNVNYGAGDVYSYEHDIYVVLDSPLTLAISAGMSGTFTITMTKKQSLTSAKFT